MHALAGQSSRRRVVSDVTRGYRILQKVREHGKELVARSGDMFGLVQLSRHVSALVIADLLVREGNRFQPRAEPSLPQSH